MKKISIIIPVYNNEGSLNLLYEKLNYLHSALLEKEITCQIIFVDDGSEDNSFELLKQFTRQKLDIKVIKLSRNFGAIHASKAGVQFASGDCFAYLAADLQDPPELIMHMVEKWLDGAKFVVCKRDKREDPLFSKFYSKIYYRLIRLFVAKKYPKSGFDLTLLDKQLLPYMQQSSKIAYTPMLAFWLGFKPEFISYNRKERLNGKSQWTLLKRISASLDVLLGFSVTPIRVISLIGIIVVFFSSGYGFWLGINAMLGNIDVKGFATIVCLFTFLFGLVIIMLGMIGEYIWRIYEEVNKLPESVIDEIYE